MLFQRLIDTYEEGTLPSSVFCSLSYTHWMSQYVVFKSQIIDAAAFGGGLSCGSIAGP